jgi:hypothetical protein
MYRNAQTFSSQTKQCCLDHFLWSGEMLMPNVAMRPLVSRRGLEPDDLGHRALDDSSRRALLLVAPDTAVLSDNALLLTNSDYCVVIAFSDGEVLLCMTKMRLHSRF